MRRTILLFSLFVTTSTFAATTDEWLADFRFILGEISSHYANLDYVIDDRRVDLLALRKRTEDRIRAAKDDAEAQRAIDSFFNAFGDGHANVRWSNTTASNTKPQSLCDRIGFEGRDLGGVNFARLEDYVPIQDADSDFFPGGILANNIGVVRIHLFSETAHPKLCSSAMAALQLTDGSECDDSCRWRVQLRAADQLTAALERRIQSLAKAGAKTIVVDLTRNGGGSNWVDPAVRSLTPVALKAPRMGFIRHPHWVKQLEERAADVRNDPKAFAALSAAAEEAKKPCDRSGVWADPPVKPDCSLVVKDDIYSTGLLPYAKPGSLDDKEAKNIYFNPSQYMYREGVNRLPLIVLIDGGTASAAEYFTAVLKDNRAARIAGLPSRGSGCGHTNGGIFVNLPNSGGRLSLPDCVRFRADGSNEVAGIVPDVLIPWSDFDSAFQRASKAKSALIGMTKRR